LIIMFKKILVATDGSRYSEQAAKFGIELAKLSQGKINIIYVADTNSYLPAVSLVPPFGGPNPHAIDKTVTELRNSLIEVGEKATRRIEELAKVVGVPSERLIIEGHSASEILKFAGEAYMELIILGRIGKTGLKKFLIGSVAERVVRNSKVPVLIVQSE
jgi:nucleotide-binding universal stress UspA family protein